MLSNIELVPLVQWNFADYWLLMMMMMMIIIIIIII